jgi:Ca-activated chloride channel homolog
MRVSRLLVGVAALLSMRAFAQDAPDAVFHSDAPLVELHATVTDHDGHLLMDLPRDTFQIFENDVPQEIKVFRHEDAPVSLGLIIDNSASMLKKRSSVAASVLTLIRASNHGDEAFIVNFNQRASLAREFTQDPAQLEATLAKIDSNGETALRDALAMGLEHLKRLARNAKKVLVVITDGEDNSSSETLVHLSHAAVQSGVLIYAIGLLGDGDEREVTRAKHDIDTLTAGTGGEAFYPKELAEVDAIARHVAHDLRNQYTLAYSPVDQKHDGSFRRIRVVVGSPQGAVVTTRSGYYAPGTPEP